MEAGLNLLRAYKVNASSSQIDARLDAAADYALASFDARVKGDPIIEGAIDAMAQASLEWTTIPLEPMEKVAEIGASMDRPAIRSAPYMVSAQQAGDSVPGAFLQLAPSPIGRPRRLPQSHQSNCRTGPWKQLLIDTGLHSVPSRARPPSIRPVSSREALRALRGLRSGLRTQEKAVLASRLRDATRRRITKQNRSEAHERARRAMPSDICAGSVTEEEAAAKGAAKCGLFATNEERLASMLRGTLNLQAQSSEIGT